MTSPTATSTGSARVRGEHARQHQVLHRVGGERGQRVDLLGHAHGAELGGDRGGDAAGDHQAAEHRAELAHDADGDDRGHHGLGVEAGAAGIDLQRQRGAGEERGQADDRQREVADAQQLLAELDRVEGRADEVRERRAPRRSSAGRWRCEQPQGRAADRGEEGWHEAEEDHAGSGGGRGLLVDAFVPTAKAGQDLVADGAGGAGEVVDGLACVEDFEVARAPRAGR